MREKQKEKISLGEVVVEIPIRKIIDVF